MRRRWVLWSGVVLTVAATVGLGWLLQPAPPPPPPPTQNYTFIQFWPVYQLRPWDGWVGAWLIALSAAVLALCGFIVCTLWRTRSAPGRFRVTLLASVVGVALVALWLALRTNLPTREWFLPAAVAWSVVVIVLACAVGSRAEQSRSIDFLATELALRRHGPLRPPPRRLRRSDDRWALVYLVLTVGAALVMTLVHVYAECCAVQ